MESGDSISRRAAIDEIRKCRFVVDAIEKIRGLPSAQPEYYDYSGIDDVWKYYAEEQDIKLTDSAKQLKDAMWVGYRKGKQDAQSERKTGQWIKVQTKTKPAAWRYSCSECGESPLMARWNYPDELSCFCPNCGADMRGEQNGET